MCEGNYHDHRDIYSRKQIASNCHAHKLRTMFYTIEIVMRGISVHIHERGKKSHDPVTASSRIY